MLTKTKPEKKGSIEEWRRRLGMPTALLEKVRSSAKRVVRTYSDILSDTRPALTEIDRIIIIAE